MFMLDLRTIMLVSILIYLLLSSGAILLSHFLSGHRALWYWSAGASGDALATLLLMLQDQTPAFLGIILARVVTIVSMCLTAHGVSEFMGLSRRIGFYVVLCVLVVASQAWFTYIDESFTGRLISISLIYSLLWAQVSYGLIKHKPRWGGQSYRFVLYTVLSLIAFFVARSLLVLANPSRQLFAPSALTSWTFLGLMLFALAMSLGLLIMAASRFASELSEANLHLQTALDNVKTLRGLLPICAHCKKIRDDQGYWNHLENYIQTHSEAEFTHSLCPECIGTLYPGLKVSPK